MILSKVDAKPLAYGNAHVGGVRELKDSFGRRPKECGARRRIVQAHDQIEHLKVGGHAKWDFRLSWATS